MTSELRERLQAALGGLYTVERELGGGGMSRVFVAEETALGRRVVVKVLPPELAAGVSVDRFRREAQLAARLHHPHLVPLLTAGEGDGLLYYTMPFIEGESLRQRLAREGELPVSEVIRLLREIAEALSCAHAQGVVHRDLKPDNVLLDHGHATVADFGVAKALTLAETASTLTSTGLALGTPAYMAPEQAAADPHIDHRADLYALGCVAYELLTGTPPFERRTPQQTLGAQISETPVPVERRRSGVPPALGALVTKLLQKRPADRPQTADEVLRLLEAVPLAGGPPAAPVPTVRIARPSVARRPMLAVFLVILAVSGGAAVIARRDPSIDPKRVAVAVFENETGDPALDPLGRMTADWLTEGLSQTQLLEVVPSTSTVPTSWGTGQPAASVATEHISTLGEATGAGTVVWGAYYRQGDSLRFHAQVTDVRHRKLLRAIEPVGGMVERPAEVIGRLRQRVTAALATMFDPQLAALSWNTIEPPTYEAYREFMSGLEHFYRSEMAEALSAFTRAESLDSTTSQSTRNHAALWAAVAYRNLDRFAESDSVLGVLTARRPQLSELERASLDWQLAGLRGDLPGQLQAARRVHQITPGSDLSEFMHGFSAEYVNRPKEALETYTAIDERGALAEWPGYWQNLSGVHHLLGDHRRELEMARRGSERFASTVALVNEVRALAAMGQVAAVDDALEASRTAPSHPWATPADVMEIAALELKAHGLAKAAAAAIQRAIGWYRARPADEQRTEGHRYGLARTLYEAGRWAEAEVAFGGLAAERPENPDFLGHLGALAARQGDRREADRISAVLATLKRPYLHGRHTFWRARIAGALGERERAVALLRESFQQGQVYGPELHTVVDFENLRDYSPFRELVRPKG